MKEADVTPCADALVRLARGARITEPTAVVIAHPDDETIGLAARLRCFDALTLIVATDGAPIDMTDARRNGLATRTGYAEVRRTELGTALTVARADPKELRFYDIVDGGAAEHLVDLTDRLVRDLAAVEIVMTHAYEGGHPDHDACAFAVQLACLRLGAAAPLQLEFAGYTGRRPLGEFWPDSRSPEIVVEMTDEEQDLKRSALAAHSSQGVVHFPVKVERYRQAPIYDFTKPPAGGEVAYGRCGAPITGRSWRRHARRALDQLRPDMC